MCARNRSVDFAKGFRNALAPPRYPCLQEGRARGADDCCKNQSNRRFVTNLYGDWRRICIGIQICTKGLIFKTAIRLQSAYANVNVAISDPFVGRTALLESHQSVSRGATRGRVQTVKIRRLSISCRRQSIRFFRAGRHAETPR